MPFITSVAPGERHSNLICAATDVSLKNIRRLGSEKSPSSSLRGSERPVWVCHIRTGSSGGGLTYSKLAMLRDVNTGLLRPFHTVCAVFSFPRGRFYVGGDGREKENAYETTKPPDK